MKSNLAHSCDSCDDLKGTTYSQCDDALAAIKDAISCKQYGYNMAYRNKKRALMVCAGDSNCTFRANLAHTNPTKPWKISMKSNLAHSCDVMVNNPKKSRYSCEDVSSMFIEGRLRSKGTFQTAKSLVTEMKEKTSTDISVHKAYKARKVAKIKAWRDELESYSKFESYIQTFLENNPGSRAWVDFDNENRFIRCGVIHSFGKIFLNHAQPLCVFDMSHLKNQKYPGRLWLIVGYDANNGLMPLGWGYSPTEDKIEWLKIHDEFAKVHGDILVARLFFFIADREKGMVPSMAEKLPLNELFPCTKHVKGNVSEKLKGVSPEVSEIMALCFSSYQKSECEKSWEKLKAQRRDIYDYLTDIGKEKLCFAYANVPKFGHQSNQGVESENNMFMQPRRMPRLAGMKWMEMYVSDRICQRREFINKWQQVVCPVVHKSLSTSHTHVQTYTVNRTTVANEFAVRTEAQTEFIVNLRSHTCSCGRFQQLQFPCVHAMSVLHYINPNNLQVYDFVHNCYTKNEWLRSYSGAFVLTNMEDLKRSDVKRLPPVFVPQSGRPRSGRIPSRGEINTNYSRRGKCTNCGQSGHYAPRCPNPPIEDFVPVGDPNLPLLPEDEPAMP